MALLAGAVAKVQTVELGTATLRALVDLTAREQPFSIFRDALSPALAALGGTFAGAALAFYFELNQKKKAERKLQVDGIFLIREDLRKAQRLLAETVVLIQKQIAPEPERITVQSLPKLPNIYLGGFDYVAALPLIGDSGVDHIRNVRTFLFPQWDDMTGQPQLGRKAIESAHYTSDCVENVIKHLESALPEIGQTARHKK